VSSGPAHATSPAPAREFSAAADSTLAAADSGAAPAGRVVEVPARPETSAPAGRSVLPRHALSGFDAPRWVMARSLVLPGWGQLHNGSWIKALAVAGGEGLLVARMREDQQALERIDQDVQAARRDRDDVREVAAVEAYNRRLDVLVGREWMFAGLLTYALLDAYVDAHFRDFKLEFENDPALPGGKAPKRGARLSLRRSF
jgi:hypothetical protein